MNPLGENDPIEGLQLVRPEERFHALSSCYPLLVLLHGRCIGMVASIPDEDQMWHWYNRDSHTGKSESQQRAIAALIEKDYATPAAAPSFDWNVFNDLVDQKLKGILQKDKEPYADQIHTLEITVDRLQNDRETWRIAEFKSQQEIGKLHGQIRKLEKEHQEITSTLSAAANDEAAAQAEIRLLKENLEKSKNENCKAVEHWMEIARDRKHRIEKLESALSAAASDVGTIHEETQRMIVRKEAAQAEIELHLKSELKKAETDREHWCNVASALQGRAHRAYWLGQENGFSQAIDHLAAEHNKAKQSNTDIDSFYISVVNRLKEWEAQSLENAEQKRPMPTIVSAVEADQAEREAQEKQEAQRKIAEERAVQRALDDRERTSRMLTFQEAAHLCEASICKDRSQETNTLLRSLTRRFENMAQGGPQGQPRSESTEPSSVPTSGEIPIDELLAQGVERICLEKIKKPLQRMLEGLHLCNNVGQFCFLSCNVKTWEEISRFLKS